MHELVFCVPNPRAAAPQGVKRGPAVLTGETALSVSPGLLAHMGLANSDAHHLELASRPEELDHTCNRSSSPGSEQLSAYVVVVSGNTASRFRSKLIGAMPASVQN